MKYRKLRIAWSVGCAIAGVLLIVLWMRSYWHCDVVYRITPTTDQTTIGSNCGTVYFSQLNITSQGFGSPAPRRWTYQLYQPARPATKRLVFWDNKGGIIQGGVSHWLLITPAAVLAAIPWIRRQFSLRALLITLTVVAVMLGLIVYAIKEFSATR
jgi:hypothetical protein